jgi:hypothetical protein
MSGRSHSPLPRNPVPPDVGNEVQVVEDFRGAVDAEQVLFHEMSPEAVFKLLFAKIPGLKAFQNVWQFGVLRSDNC